MSDPDAERAVLGCALLDSGTLPILAGLLRPEFFTDSRNETVFRAILALHESTKPVEPLVLQSHLAREGNLDAAGGTLYLLTLEEAVLGGTSAAAEWAEIVAAHAMRREAMGRVASLSARLISADDPAAEIEATAEELRTLATSGTASRRSPWTVLDAAEIDESEPPTPYVVDGLVPAESIVVFSGHGGSFKSCLLAQMAHAVATGTDFLGHATEQGAVLWVNADMPRRACKQLHAAIRRGAGHPLESPLFLIPETAPPLDLGNAMSVRLLADEVKRRAVRLLVLDCLSAVRGAADENSNTEMLPVMQALRRVTRETGAAVVVVHHVSKEAATAYRGASVIRDLLDMNYRVEREGRTDVVKVAPDKARFAMPKPFAAQWNAESVKRPTMNGRVVDELARAWFTPATVASDLDEAANAVFSLLAASGPMKAGEIDAKAAKDSGLSRGLIRKVRELLVSRDEIVVHPGKFGAKAFAIPGAGGAK